MRRFLTPLFGLFLLAAPAVAVQPDEMLPDPALETRAREISKDLRCVVCQNENIDESNAELARDLRLLVRDRLTKGDTDDEVVEFIVARYGDYVLLTPPFKATTYALWFSPVIFLAVALWAAWRFYGRAHASTADGPPPEASPLTDEERERLQRLLRDEEGRV